MKQLLIILFLSTIINNCIPIFGFEQDCSTREEIIERLPPGAPFPFLNIYNIVNELDSRLEIIIYYTNNFTSSSSTQSYLLNDTLQADINLFTETTLESPPPEIFIVNDSVEIVLQTNPKVCLKYRGNITDSLTDIRSRRAYQREELEQTEEVSKRKSFVKNWVSKIGFWFKNVFTAKEPMIAASDNCPSLEGRIDNFFKINETHLNQATEEACTEQ